MSEELGLKSKKKDFSEWYNEVIQKAEMADHSSVSGCMVIRPYAYSIWESISGELDRMFKKRGVKNAYFPLLIPEHLLKKEAEHVEGFNPEVAWVTHTGNSKLEERLAIRPTSEAIMYESFSKWIRSWRDLPMKINQFCNILRWEFKHPMLFIRTREFLWQEGHTAFATKEHAEKDVEEALEDYRTIMEDYLAVPVTKGLKTEKEKFAGADYSRTIETMLPDGWAIQIGTSHHLGQNFSKPFGIQFADKSGNKNGVWQNSWGITTRTIGIMIALHGDDKGLIMPPKIAPVQIVIIPIYKDESKISVLKEANKLFERLSEEGFRVHLDDRDTYTPGFKFNEWELKGVSIRIEIGPKDIENKTVMVVRRDKAGKVSVERSKAVKHIEKELDKMQTDLFERASKLVDSLTFKASSYSELKKNVESGRVAADWCGSRECEDSVKDETKAKISCIISDSGGKCIKCGKKAKRKVYFARSY